MRYSLSTLACAALAATTLAAPVMEKRAREVLIFTDYTTIVVTKTILTGAQEAQETATVQAEWVKGGNYGQQPSPVYTTRTTTLEPITIGTRTTTLPTVTSTLEPITVVTSAPAVEVPGTTTVVQEVTSSPSPVTIITTIQEETTTPTPEAPVQTTTSAEVVTSVAPAETTTAVAATTVTSAAAPADTWAAAVLNAHNTRRALHGAPALTWDTTMASYAASLSAKCVFDHSGGPYGENLAAGYATPDDAIEAWYVENTSYNYATGLFSEATGHFTQLVWKSATKVGCGIATCGTSTTPGDMLTCEYDTGNVVGYFVQNVLPLV